jgi:hypothetical protein
MSELPPGPAILENVMQSMRVLSSLGAMSISSWHVSSAPWHLIATSGLIPSSRIGQ